MPIVLLLLLVTFLLLLFLFPFSSFLIALLLFLCHILALLLILFLFFLQYLLSSFFPPLPLYIIPLLISFLLYRLGYGLDGLGFESWLGHEIIFFPPQRLDRL